ncbi:MAG: SufD family Fe-S cluster assembly protein, partial [Actinomycetales bacterium]|nr:SufD family Fe-S cluster assembly protein [Actinomycetales bacterium]
MSTQVTLEPQAQPGSSAHSHGYVPGESDIPVQSRAERVRSTDVADFAPISRREEQWKYTTSEQILGLDEDALNEFMGDFELKAPDNVTTAWVGSEHPAFGAAGIPEDRASAAAWGSAEQAYLITLPANQKLDCEVQLGIVSHDTAASALHLIVEAKSGSEGTVIIDHRGDAVLSENVEIIVGDNAHLTVVSIQDFNRKSVHLSAQFAKLGRNANLKHVVVTLGGDVVRVTPNAVFAAPGAQVDLLGVYFADAGQQMEHR